MANVLGSLFVELGINTAAFVEGVSKATYQAKAGAQQIGSSFSAIGSKLAEVGAQFGTFGGIVGQSIGTVGKSISSLVHEAGSLSGLSGAAKLGGIGFIAMGAAALTAAGAVIGIAVHASEAAARIYQLSQATGVSVKDLSGLGIVGQLVGVNMETLAHGLERMDRSALMAAKSPNAVTNAYKQLGISVTDTTGHLKPTTELFGEVADKFSVMQDGATKTALAMQIFGRAGAELIPVLNKGSESLKYWMDYGTSVGAVLDEKAAAGAEAFHNELTKLDLISTGVQNKLMVALLPALDHITAALTAFVSKGDTIVSFGEIVGSVLTSVAGVVFRASYAWTYWGEAIKMTGAIAYAVAHGDFRAIPQIVKDSTDEVIRASAKLQEELDALHSKSITAPGPEAPRQTQQAPVTQPIAKFANVKPEVDIVGELVSKTELATAAQIAQANAVNQTTAAMMVLKATEEAISKIAETRTELDKKMAALDQEASQAAKAGATDKLAAINQQKVAIAAQLNELADAKEKLVALFDTKAVLAFGNATVESMTKSNEKLQETVKALQAMNAAMQKGGAAVVSAQIEEKLAEDKTRVDEVTAAYKQLTQQQGVTSAALNAAASEVDKANAALSQHRTLLEQEHAATIADQEAHYNLAATYRTEMVSLEEMMTVARANNDITAQMGIQAKELAANNSMTKAWDDAALAVGTYNQKAQAVLNELALESQNVSGKIAQSFKTMVDGVSGQFASMVATGKFNFESLFTTLEESIIKALASKALSDLLNKLASLGSPGSGGGGGISGGATSTGSNAGGGGFGGFLGSLLSLIPHASGGDTAPGVGYLVGEQGPEAFFPKAPGTIVPNSATMSASPMQNPNVNVHVYGATDPDTFRKASPQIAAAMFRQLQTSYAHNGR